VVSVLADSKLELQVSVQVQVLLKVLAVAMAHQAMNPHHILQAQAVLLVLVALMLPMQLSRVPIQTRMDVLMLQNSTNSFKVAYKKLTLPFNSFLPYLF